MPSKPKRRAPVRLKPWRGACLVRDTGEGHLYIVPAASARFLIPLPGERVAYVWVREIPPPRRKAKKGARRRG